MVVGRYDAAKNVSFDMVSANIVLADKIYILDYEWTFDFAVPLKFILYRSILLNGTLNVIPEEKKNSYSKEACNIFTLLTNIYQDVVIPHTTRIDYSFLEVMFAEKIGFAKKMIYINEYPRYEWKSALNSTFFSNDLLGN